MKPFTRVLSAFAVGILLQGGVYLYLDQYMFAPTTDFNVAGASKDDTKNFPDVKEGTKYVSYDRQFMAVVTESSLKIYKANESKPTTAVLLVTSAGCLTVTMLSWVYMTLERLLWPVSMRMILNMK